MRKYALTALVVIVSILLTCTALAVESGTCGDNLTWFLDDNGVLTISGIGAMYDHVSWTEQLTKINSVVIEEGVTNIGSSAFEGCSNLTSISISDSVTSIGEYAFKECNSLASILIPESVTDISNGAFYNCKAIKYVTIDANAARVLSRAAYSFRILGEKYSLIYFFSGDTVIEKRMLSADKDIIDFMVPEGITSIGPSTFKGCSNLRSISMPDSVNYIDYGAFDGCSNLTSIVIPEGVNTIEGEAFQGCSNLKSITIPDSVAYIGEWAFSGCDNLEKICFLNRNTEIRMDSVAFEDLAEKKIYCYEYSYIDLWAKDRPYQIIYLDNVNLETIQELTLPENLFLISGTTRQVPIQIFPSISGDYQKVEWMSSDPRIVTVDEGIVKTLEPGTATLTATIGSASATMLITVYYKAEAFELLPGEEEWVVAKENVQLSTGNFSPVGANAIITWESSDSKIAIVDQNGLVETYRPGDVIISAKTEYGVHRECLLHICYPVTSIDFEPINETVIPGQEIALTANVTMRTQSCVNHLVTFSSSDNSIATVDENGIMHTLNEGEVTITAMATSGVTGKITLLVDHDWGETVYEWSEDYHSVTARRFCKCNAAHTEEETVQTNEEILVAPSCTEKGIANYTSTSFQKTAFLTQKKEQVEIAELGHDWGEPTYIWDDGLTHVTASHCCSRDASHSETETVDVKMIVISPTETLEGQVIYNALFSNSSFLEQERKREIPAL